MELENEDKAIQLLATGLSTKKVSDQLEGEGTSQKSVWRLSQAKRDQIHEQALRLTECLPDLIDTIKQDISTATLVAKVVSGELPEDKLPPILQDAQILNKFMDLTFKQRTDIMKALGLLPSTQPSTVITNIFKEGSNTVIAPQVLNVLNKHIKEELD